MPFISVKTNKNLSGEQKNELKSFLGKAICAFPGKSESWLMCEIDSDKDMYFKGSDEPCMFVEVKLFGAVDKSCSEKFTALLCEKIENYGISASRVYVRYEGGTSWGWNGSNF